MQSSTRKKQDNQIHKSLHNVQDIMFSILLHYPNYFFMYFPNFDENIHHSVLKI